MLELKKYRKARKEIDSLNNQEHKEDERLEKELEQIKDKFWKLERDLTDKKIKEETKIDKAKEKSDKLFEKKKEEGLKILGQYRKIIKLIGVIKKYNNYGLKEPKVYDNDYIYGDNGNNRSENTVKLYYKPIKVLVDDEYKKIYLYITKNEKPKNCFSLIVVGNTIFNKEVIDIHYSYGLYSRVEDSNIQIGLNDFPDEEKARSYLKRNEKRVLKEFLEEHKKVEIEYEKIKKVIEDSKEWDIEYLKSRKNYYEKHYSEGTKTEEYKEIIKELETLNEVKK